MGGAVPAAAHDQMGDSHPPRLGLAAGSAAVVQPAQPSGPRPVSTEHGCVDFVHDAIKEMAGFVESPPELAGRRVR